MPIEARGRRDPALAARMRGEAPEPVQDYDYFVGRRPLKVGQETRPPGAPIPEAGTWPRLDSWISTGSIVRKPHQPGAYDEAAEKFPPTRRMASDDVIDQVEEPKPERPARRARPAKKIAPRRPVASDEEERPRLRPLRPRADA